MVQPLKGRAGACRPGGRQGVSPGLGPITYRAGRGVAGGAEDMQHGRPADAICLAARYAWLQAAGVHGCMQLHAQHNERHAHLIV
eukprot:365930-Chlamydomonas_euryale.AAC.37